MKTVVVAAFAALCAWPASAGQASDIVADAIAANRICFQNFDPMKLAKVAAAGQVDMDQAVRIAAERAASAKRSVETFKAFCASAEAELSDLR